MTAAARSRGLTRAGTSAQPRPKRCDVRELVEAAEGESPPAAQHTAWGDRRRAAQPTTPSRKFWPWLAANPSYTSTRPSRFDKHDRLPAEPYRHVRRKVPFASPKGTLTNSLFFSRSLKAVFEAFKTTHRF